MWAVRTDVDRVEILPPLLTIDNDFLRRRDARWWTAVYFCLNGPRDHIWWELFDSFHDNGHPDHVQGIDVDAVDMHKELTSMLSTCIPQQAYDSRWFQWAATVWMQVMLSLKDSRAE
jgi:hypothetical protein